MTLDEYQDAAMKTAIYPNQGNNLPYAVLGLCGEAGEVAEKVKKMIRDDAGELSNIRRHELQKELADVLWYCAAVASELHTTLQDIADIGITKLASRRERGVLSGSGDNR